MNLFFLAVGASVIEIMSAPFKHSFLAVLVCCLSGCYVPMGFHNVDYDSGVNPFDKIRILNDQGALEVIISDESKDLRNLRITDAKLLNSQGEFVPTTLDPGGLTHESSSQQNASFFFRMTYRSNMHFERPPFHLKIRGFDGATPFSIDAKFTDQVHYQMINLEDALDHG